MKTKKPDIGNELIEGMKNAVAHTRGRKRAARKTVVRARIPTTVDVGALRRRLGMSQAASPRALASASRTFRIGNKACVSPKALPVLI